MTEWEKRALSIGRKKKQQETGDDQVSGFQTLGQSIWLGSGWTSPSGEPAGALIDVSGSCLRHRAASLIIWTQ
jgi:hypothetical protein